MTFSALRFSLGLVTAGLSGLFLYIFWALVADQVRDDLREIVRKVLDEAPNAIAAVVSLACAAGVLYGFWLLGTSFRTQDGKESSCTPGVGVPRSYRLP